MIGLEFAGRFDRYISEAQAARTADKHHDHRRTLFLAFLADAFGVDLGQVEQEQYIQLRGQ